MKILTSILLALSTLLISGCASLIVHCSEPPRGEHHPRYIYSGTQVSAGEIKSSTDYISSPRYGYDAFDPLWPIAWLILVVDFPLTVAADTLFLPYDAYKVTIGGKTRYGDERLPTTD